MARLQSRKSSCGPAALVNALDALGLKRSEEELIALCKTTPKGTNWVDMLAAARTIEGVIGKEIEESKADVALLRLLQAQYDGRPVIVIVDDWDHYSVVSGVLGFGSRQRLVCIDSADNDVVRYRSHEEMERWWRGPGKKPYAGVVL